MKDNNIDEVEETFHRITQSAKGLYVYKNNQTPSNEEVLKALEEFAPTFTAPDGDVVDNELYKAYNTIKQALSTPKITSSYRMLKDDEWRGQKLRGRIIFMNDKEKYILTIHTNGEISRFSGGMDLDNLSKDDILFLANHFKGVEK